MSNNFNTVIVSYQSKIMNEDVRASVFYDIDGCVNEDCNYI